MPISDQTSWLQGLKDFQTFIGAFVGFTGVTLTLWWNARQAHLAREDTIERQRTATRVAMREELRLVAAELRHIDNQVTDRPSSSLQLVPFVKTEIYSVLLKDLGLLRPEEVSALVLAHTAIRSLRNTLRIMGKEEAGYLEIEPVEFMSTRAYVRSCLEETEKAVRALSR